MIKEIYFSENIKKSDIKNIEWIFNDSKISENRYIRKGIWQYPLEIFIVIWNEIKESIELLESKKIEKALRKEYSNKKVKFHIKQEWREIILNNTKVFITENWKSKEFNNRVDLIDYLKNKNEQNEKFKLEIKDEKICINYRWLPFYFKSELDWKDLLWIIKMWLDSYVKTWLQIWEMKKDIIKYIMTVSITLIWVIIWVFIKAPNSWIRWALNFSLFFLFVSIIIGVLYWAFYINFWKNVMEKITKESFIMFKKIDWENILWTILNFLNNFTNLWKQLNKEKYIYYSILITFVIGLIFLISSFIFK